MSIDTGTIPSHVRPELVVDFDFIRPAAEGIDPYSALKRLHGGPDFSIKPGAAVRTGTGIVPGVLSLPLSWRLQ